MKSLYRCALLLFASLLVLPHEAVAVDWPPIDPADLAMTSLPQQPGAPAVVLYHEEIADDINNMHSVYLRIKILTEAGRKYADVEMPVYNRRNFLITEISGRTVHADGSVVPFEGKPFDKTVLKDRGVQYHVKAFTLPDVQVGSILDYRYYLRYGDHSAFAPEWILQGDLYQKKESFKFTPYEGLLNLPHDRIGRGIAWTTHLPTGRKPILHEYPRNSFTSEHRANPDWIGLEMEDVPALVEEPYAPPINTLRYRVRFYYMVGSNAEAFWKDEGKYWSKYVESFIGRNRGVLETVNQVVAPGDTAEQKAKKLYTFVGQLENRSYIPAREEEEQHALGVKPNEGAEDVLQQKSGTHNDLARLYVAMARTVGIPAQMMIVPDREHAFFDPNYLSMDQFDGELAILQIDGKEVFLDPGSKFCPYGLLDWRYGGSRGIRQSASKDTDLGDSPPSTPNSAMVQRLAHLNLSVDGRVDGTLTVGFYGLEAMNRRQRGGKTDDEGRKKQLEDEVKRWLPAGAEVSMTKPPNWKSAEVPLAAEFKISSPFAVSAGKRWLIATHVFQLNQKPLFPATQRANPVYLYYPSREIDQIHITLPSNTEVESLPPASTVQLDYAIYTTGHKMENTNTILSTRDIGNAGYLFPASAYKEVKDFYDKVKTGDDQQAILKASANAGTH
jgi:hypothetical protein